MDTTVYNDPSRIFRIRVPDGFQRKGDARGLVFIHDALDGAVTVSALRHERDLSDVNLLDSLPSADQMQNVNERRENGVRIVSGEYEGELQNQPEAWHWWAVQKGPVGIVVSLNGSPQSVAQNTQRVEELVEGIDVRSVLPMSSADFTDLAARVYARTLEKPDPKITGPLELKTEGDAILRLENAYVSYLDSFEQDDATQAEPMLTNWFESLWGEQTEKLGAFKDIQTLLYPVIKPHGYAAKTNIPILRRDLIEEELEVLVALDTGRTLRFLSQEDLKAWDNIDEDDVFFFARENLAELSREMDLTTLPDDDGNTRAVIFSGGDGHDASRVLLPTLFDRMHELLGDDLRVGIPNRDFMIVFRHADDQIAQNISAQIANDSQNRPYAISGRVYRLTKDGLALS